MFDRMVTYEKARKAVQQCELPGYFLDFHQGGRQGGDTLLVTFENADPVRDRLAADRRPWGFDFLQKQGFSILGVKPKAVDWYRGADLHGFFRSAAFAGFADRFRRRIFYGSSMGGYAALAFSDCGEGHEAIAFNPQSTLDPALVPWERRYPEGRAQDWSGDFADARRARHSRRALVVYDPFFAPDRRHVQRLPAAGITAFKVPLVGHAVAQWLARMGTLRPLVLGRIEGSLTPASMAQLARPRRGLPRYYSQLARTTRRPGVIRRCIAELEARGLDEGMLREFLPMFRRQALWLEAECMARGHLASDPASLAAHRVLAEALLGQQRGAEALGLLQAAEALWPGNPDLAALQARLAEPRLAEPLPAG
ncbi:tetratricopeptide repeat protein [Roseomonas sp. 18066]|uniref:tetratricopeptide repeat protein n=1 Tax=Roseomonas sp. 18066 TaxID=2681412 RepID=UPI00135AC570|nr:tetratricopeptide repeat protein [Roseomonas sp. 18066]